MKFINPKIHGVIDYLAVALLFLAPSLFGFNGTTAGNLSYLIGIVQLGLSLTTAYPMGLIRAIPFPVHGMIELTAGIAMLFLPWMFGFTELAAARNFFVISGLILGFVWSTTNYRAALSHNYVYKFPYKEIKNKDHEEIQHRRAA